MSRSRTQFARCRLSRRTPRCAWIPGLLALWIGLIGEGGVAFAQTQVIILEPTRRISAEIIDGEQVRKILGDVRLDIDGRIVQCDSAIQYLERPLVIAYRVNIEDEEESIRAERLYYDTESEIATFVGEVDIRSREYTAFGDTVDMDLDTRDGNLRGRVQWFDSTRYAEADQAFVAYRDKRYRLEGRVYGESLDGLELFRSDTLVTDSTGSAWLDGNAWLRIISEEVEEAVQPDSVAAGAPGTPITAPLDSLSPTTIDTLPSDTLAPKEVRTDTTILTAGSVSLVRMPTDSTADAGSEEERISAGGFPQPVIWSTRLSSRSDSLHYDTSTGLYQLMGAPLAWMEQLQLSADWITATIQDERVRNLRAGDRPVVVIEDSVTLRLNQMTGDTLNARFDPDGELQQVEFTTNSELVYHQRDERDEPDGAVRITSQGLARVLFEDGDVRQLAGQENIDGFYVPESPQAEELRVAGFRWDPDLRPLPSTPPERRFSRLYPVFRALSSANDTGKLNDVPLPTPDPPLPDSLDR